ncbi:MAG: nucleoside-diphosphate sugar epimerase/dehydratase [Flavobacteriales bacterium]
MIKTLRERIIQLSRNQKTALLIFTDIVTLNSILIATVILTTNEYYENSIRIHSPILLDYLKLSFFQILLINAVSLTIISALNGYKSFFRSSGVMNLVGTERIFGLLSYCILLSVSSFSTSSIISKSIIIGLINLFTVFFQIVLVRSIAFNFLSLKSDESSAPILIYGAGQAGRETAASISQNPRYKIIGFIDDDKKLKNFNILGYKVLGNQKKIEKLKKTYPNVIVVMALVRITAEERKKIISSLEKFEVQVKTIPYNYGALETKLSIEDISVSDLIDRKIKVPNKILLESSFHNKNILITGAGGSIGSEISRQIADLKPAKLFFVDSSEFNLFKLKESFKSYKNLDSMNFILKDVQDTQEMEKLLNKNSIDSIYHASAYKHVPLLQSNENFSSAIENNFFATYDLCSIANKNNVKSFVLISSDKAVNPANLMGATKRLAELSLQAFQDIKDNKTIFSMVRFGNVLNSSGSVVPLFWEQISRGGPVTVTHEDINRFFMTIKEAASLVLQSGAMAKGGEVFLLDMGDPIKIKEFAERMIRLSGNSVASDGKDNGIQIVYSGLRPGEKLYEELLLSDNPLPTEHDDIRKAVEEKYPLNEIKELKDSLKNLLLDDKLSSAKNLISKFVKGF